MEKRVFCKALAITVVIYGLNLTGCSQKSDSGYHDISRNNSVEDSTSDPNLNDEKTGQAEPILKAEKVQTSQASVDSSINSTVQESQATNEKNPVTTGTDIPGTKKQETEKPVKETDKIKAPPEKSTLLAKNDQADIKPVEFEKTIDTKKPLKATKPIEIKNRPEATKTPEATKSAEAKKSGTAPPEKKKREVKILVPEKRFRREGKNKIFRVSYDDVDLLRIINMEPVTPDAPEKMPQWLKDLDGKRIRIRGFMYPHHLAEGIEIFALARDNDICCFIKKPRIYDVFNVFLRKGKQTDYIEGKPFDVEGVFHIKVEAEEGEMLQLYYIDDAVVLKK